MWAYILRRVILMVPTLIGISLINFLLINAADAPRNCIGGSKDDNYKRITKFTVSTLVNMQRFQAWSIRVFLQR